MCVLNGLIDLHHHRDGTDELCKVISVRMMLMLISSYRQYTKTNLIDMSSVRYYDDADADENDDDDDDDVVAVVFVVVVGGGGDI